MDRTITKLDDLTMKIAGSTPYEQVITKDQLIARVAEIDSNIAWFNARIDSLNSDKAEVNALLEEAETLWLLTENEKQALNPTPAAK